MHTKRAVRTTGSEVSSVVSPLTGRIRIALPHRISRMYSYAFLPSITSKQRQ